MESNKINSINLLYFLIFILLFYNCKPKETVKNIHPPQSLFEIQLNNLFQSELDSLSTNEIQNLNQNLNNELNKVIDLHVDGLTSIDDQNKIFSFRYLITENDNISMNDRNVLFIEIDTNNTILVNDSIIPFEFLFNYGYSYIFNPIENDKKYVCEIKKSKLFGDYTLYKVIPYFVIDYKKNVNWTQLYKYVNEIHKIYQYRLNVLSLFYYNKKFNELSYTQKKQISFLILYRFEINFIRV